jgi:KDO2-lipid IV(A) lauroyltransferase
MSQSLGFFSITIITIFKYMGRLPLVVLQKMGIFVGFLAWIFPIRYKKKLIANVKQAFPQHASEFPRLALQQIFQMYFELPFFWSKENDNFLRQLNAEFDWSIIEKSLESNKGAILVSAHVGAYELLLPLFSLDHTLTAVYKPARSSWLNNLMLLSRSMKNLKMVPANRNGTNELIHDLRNGQAIGMLVDHLPPKGSGVYAAFFQRPAYTLTLVQRLQKLTGSPIYAVGIERLRDSQKFRLHIIPMEDSVNSDPVEFATKLNQLVEQLICLMPTQYLWGYSRYKAPAKDLS